MKIFICDWINPSRIISTELFQNLISGEVGSEHVISDLKAENVHNRNDLSELRHQYFIWKNMANMYDYVGFEHYRRLFYIDPRNFADPNSPNSNIYDSDIKNLRLRLFAESAQVHLVNTNIFDCYWALRASFNREMTDKVKLWVASSDIIVPQSDNVDLAHTWRLHHDPSQWAAIVKAFSEVSRTLPRSAELTYQLKKSYYNNMYIMKSSLFSEYMEFLFGVIDQLTSSLTNQQHRMFGYVAERVFSLWLYHKRVEIPTLRIVEVPVIMHQPALD